MNPYENAIRQAAIDSDRQERLLRNTFKGIFKGQWCIIDEAVFCQEDSGCPNCEVFIRSKGDTNEIRQ